MGKFLKSCLNGIFMGAKPWIFFGLLIPILFFVVHPFDPTVVFGLSILVVALYLTNKWKKERPAAKKATEEAQKAGVKFVGIDPEDETKESPLKRFENKFYPLMCTCILSACMLSCSYQMIHRNATERERKAAMLSIPSQVATPTGEGRKVALTDSTAVTEWNINNIDMVHLSDPDQYVTNSDSILSQETVDQMNTMLQELDSIGKVKTAVVICHKLSNNDSYRTAVDLMNKHRIGSTETGKGVCIVVAYDQHKYTIAPSRDMESDLPDALCSQLGRTQLEPYLKGEQPDSAMLCLTQALSKYVLDLQKTAQEDEGTFSLKKRGLFNGQSGMNMLIILVLCMLFGYLDDHHKWTKPVKNAASAANLPTEGKQKEQEKRTEEPETPVPPKRKGGSYGGGSSGGGGATGSW